MYSPWATSMPCLFSPHPCFHYKNQFEKQPSYYSYDSNDCLISSLNNLDLSNPFNFVATYSPTSSVWSLNSQYYPHHENDQHQEESSKTKYFEPLPFLEPQKQINYPQLSQKHTIIKQMIARKNRSNNTDQSYSTSWENLSSSSYQRQKRRLCSFCKSNGESASVYTSHALRNKVNEIECPVLMAYACPRCGATGKSAHTIKYCPSLSEGERVALPTVKLLKEGRSSSGNQNLFKKSN